MLDSIITNSLINKGLSFTDGLNKTISKITNLKLNKMYEVYIDDLLLPVAPSKIDMKYPNLNKVYNLVNGSQFNVIKEPGLFTIEFECMIPGSYYSFSLYKASIYRPPSLFLERLKTIKKNNNPIKLKIIRNITHNTNVLVTLEDFNYEENSEEGKDIILKLKFKEYRELVISKVETVEIRESITTEALSNVKKLNEIKNSSSVDNTKVIKIIQRPNKNRSSVKKLVKKPSLKNIPLTIRKYVGFVDTSESIDTFIENNNDAPISIKTVKERLSTFSRLPKTINIEYNEHNPSWY